MGECGDVGVGVGGRAVLSVGSWLGDWCLGVTERVGGDGERRLRCGEDER